MFDPSKFTVQKAKPLPIMLMLDVSGSMSGVKIDTLNEAVRTMIASFADEEKMETDTFRTLPIEEKLKAQKAQK